LLFNNNTSSNNSASQEEPSSSDAMSVDAQYPHATAPVSAVTAVDRERDIMGSLTPARATPPASRNSSAPDLSLVGDIVELGNSSQSQQRQAAVRSTKSGQEDDKMDVDEEGEPSSSVEKIIPDSEGTYTPLPPTAANGGDKMVWDAVSARMVYPTDVYSAYHSLYGDVLSRFTSTCSLTFSWLLFGQRF
jgi:hypothetical protein